MVALGCPWHIQKLVYGSRSHTNLEKKTGWWHQLRREKRDKLMVKKHFEASLPKA